MKFLAVASALFLGALAVPTTQCGECEKHQHEHSGDNYPIGNNPGNGGSYPGGNSGYPGYPGGNAPGGGNPGYPGGNLPGNPGGNLPGGNSPGGNTPGGGPGGNNPGGNGNTPGGGNNPGGNGNTPGGGNNPGGNGNTPGGGNNPGGNGNTPGGGNNPGGNGNTPGGNSPGAAYDACTSELYSNAQCCSVDVLGLLGLDCANPTFKATSAEDFKATCSKAGKQPRCCVLPVAGQDVLCVKPTGVY